MAADVVLKLAKTPFWGKVSRLSSIRPSPISAKRSGDYIAKNSKAEYFYLFKNGVVSVTSDACLASDIHCFRSAWLRACSGSWDFERIVSTLLTGRKHLSMSGKLVLQQTSLAIVRTTPEQGFYSSVLAYARDSRGMRIAQ